MIFVSSETSSCWPFSLSLISSFFFSTPDALSTVDAPLVDTRHRPETLPECLSRVELVGELKPTLFAGEGEGAAGERVKGLRRLRERRARRERLQSVATIKLEPSFRSIP